MLFQHFEAPAAAAAAAATLQPYKHHVCVVAVATVLIRSVI
jgi:hypothetical protein